MKQWMQNKESKERGGECKKRVSKETIARASRQREREESVREGIERERKNRESGREERERVEGESRERDKEQGERRERLERRSGEGIEIAEREADRERER